MTRPADRYRHARAATAVLFAVNGALFAGLLPRYPELKDDLGMTNTVLGLVVAAFPVGALLAGPTAAALIRRNGPGRVAVVTSVALSVLLLGAALAPSPGWLAAALLTAGAADAVTDVAQNSHGLAVQRHYGRSIINQLHATWSVGAVLGGLLAAGAMAVGMPRAVQLCIAAVAFGALSLAASRFLLSRAESLDSPADGAAAAGVRPGREVVVALAALAALAIAGAVIEDAGSSWAAVYLNDDLGAPVQLAAFGYIALAGCQFLGRSAGDWAVDRFGEAVVVRAGGLLAAAGMGAALAFPGVVGTIAGFGMAGLGVATVAPAAFHGADNLPGLRPGTGLTVVTWLMRIGFLGSPPLVGVIADAAGLRVALLVVPVAGVVVAVCATVLGTTRYNALVPGRTRG